MTAKQAVGWGLIAGVLVYGVLKAMDGNIVPLASGIVGIALGVGTNTISVWIGRVVGR